MRRFCSPCRRAWSCRQTSTASRGVSPGWTRPGWRSARFFCTISTTASTDFAVELFSRYGFKPANQRTYRNLTLIARLASAGLGITFLPETFADPSYRLDYYSIGETGCFRPLALGYPYARYRSNAVTRFAALLKETLLAEQEAFRARCR